MFSQPTKIPTCTNAQFNPTHFVEPGINALVVWLDILYYPIFIVSKQRVRRKFFIVRHVLDEWSQNSPIETACCKVTSSNYRFVVTRARLRRRQPYPICA
jgi:hypothetical protein